MKKFTFLIATFLFILFAGAQNKNDLHNNLQRAHEKISKSTQRTALLSKLIEKQSLNPQSVLKSAATKQKLDSMVIRTLNEETQLWQNDSKVEFYYDAELKSTFMLSKVWNETTKTWDTESKTELGYDNQDRINSMLSYSRDSLTQPLTPISKILVFYNSEGMQDSTLTYSTNNAGISWILIMKGINHYNASKQLIKKETWNLDEDLGVLTLSMNMVNTYTASGEIETSSTAYIMDGDEIPWSKSEYFYDGADRLISVEFSTINFTTFTIEKYSRDTYQYNASGKVSVEIYSTWNGTSWDEYDKTVYEYDAAGDVSVAIYSTWNGTSWDEVDKDEYTFNTTNFSDVVFPLFTYLFGLDESTELSYNNVITGVNYFEMINGSWKNTEKTLLYYSDGTSTNITELTNTLFTVYPNPAADQVNFSWKGNFESLSLEMYQVTGVKVIEQITYSGRPVSISRLENGAYFYKLLDGNQTIYSGKLIKK